MNTNNKEGLVKIVKKTYVLLILLCLLVTTSYAWFSISRTPKVSDMGISIASQSGLELAYKWDSDDEVWTQHLDLSQILVDSAPLKPVTWVNSENTFYASEHGSDGRMTGITKRLSDMLNANQDNSEGYYIKTTFFARTGTNVSVSLTPATVTSDGTGGAGTYVIGTPLWDDQAIVHNNGGNGAEYTIRVGIKITKLDEFGNEKADNVQFYVYEPNYDGHVDGSVGAVETQSIDGSATLVPEEYMIRQTTSTWTEAYPVQRDVQIKELGEFLSEPYLFELSPNEFAKIDLYFWMEGQDIDCMNTIGTNAKIMANMQFSAKSEGDSGLETFR